MNLTIRGNGPVELTLVDSSFGLPPAGNVLVEARPSHVVPIDRGDRTIVFTRVQL